MISQKPRVVIGVSTYNGASRLDQLIASIVLRTPQATQGPGDAILAVVDDGSPDSNKTKAVADKWHDHFRDLKYIEHGKNRGISAGWNSAARAGLEAGCDYAVIVNDDVIVASGAYLGHWLDALLHPLIHCPQVGAVGVNWHAFLDEDVGGLLSSPTSDQAVTPRDPGSKKPTPERRDYENCPPGRVMAPGGQLFAFRREDFDAIGGFDEGYRAFFEESCFSTSMAAHRKKIGVQLNSPMCWHRWSATFGANPELRAHERMRLSRQRYCDKWGVPASHRGDRPGPFDYTNPKFLGAIGDVEVQYLKADGTVGRVLLKQDGSHQEL